MTEELINRGYLDKLVKELDTWIDSKSLIIDEQRLLFDIMKDRINNKVAELKMKDAYGKIPIGSLFRKVMNHKKSKEDGLDE